MGVLKLADQWCLDNLRAQAIRETSTSVNKMSLVERIALAKKYNVSNWLLDNVSDGDILETTKPAGVF